MSEYIITRLSLSDYEDAVDFLNLVFSHAHSPTDFPALLPKIYRPVEELVKCNFAVKRNGRIRAIVGLFPMEAMAGGRILKVGGIGGVATHPSERGAGLMKKLMEACISEMKEEGYHMSCLGGMRQRYGYYGYEKCGMYQSYAINRVNAKHATEYVTGDGIYFERMEEKDVERLSFAKKIHDSQPFCCIRPAQSFFLCLKSWKSIPWAVLDNGGRMIGYIIANGTGGVVNEIITDNPDRLPDLIFAWFRECGISDLTVNLAPWLTGYARKLDSICESVSIFHSYNFRIFKWEEVLEALFAVKSTFSKLADGEAAIGIKEYGTFKVRVWDNAAVCEPTEEQPDILLNGLAAHRVMFGPLPPAYAVNVPDHLEPVFSSWFPLPLHWPRQDGV